VQVDADRADGDRYRLTIISKKTDAQENAEVMNTNVSELTPDSLADDFKQPCLLKD
jgi:hypothetical protein